MHISSLSIYRYKVPLTAPVKMPMRVMHRREGLLIRIASVDGEVGWGEASPLPGYSRERLHEATRQAFKLKRILTGHHFNDEWDELEDAVDALGRGSELVASVRFGVELALRNLFAEEREEMLPAMLTESPQEEVRVGALITSEERAQVLEEAHRLRDEGYRAVKFKVGRGSIEEEAKTARALAETLGSQIELRLDANRAWDLDEAVDFAEALGDTPISYIEEPLYRAAELPAFVEETGVPVALDETLRDLTPDDLADHDYASAVVLKPMVLGGMSRTLRMVHKARELGLKAVLSSAYETGIATMGLVVLAATLDDPRPMGLDTYRKLDKDVVRPRLKMEGGRIDVESLVTIKRTMNGHMLREV